ncbi:MAG: hypothetical protein QNK42_17960 [Pseudodonghicola sp.]|nr:hypothetical protein [Pseudodonghicola sp.]
MRSDALLELIWGEAIEVRGPEELSPLARLLGALLTVPMVTLVAHADDNRPFAMMESDELLPDAPLGDILAEELGLDVPRDAVVLIEPIGFADAASFSGRALGEELGRILGDIAATCTTGPKGGFDAIRPAGGDPLRPALRALTRDIARILPDTRTPRQEELRAR